MIIDDLFLRPNNVLFLAKYLEEYQVHLHDRSKRETPRNDHISRMKFFHLFCFFVYPTPQAICFRCMFRFSRREGMETRKINLNFMFRQLNQQHESLSIEMFENAVANHYSSFLNAFPNLKKNICMFKNRKNLFFSNFPSFGSFLY